MEHTHMGVKSPVLPKSFQIEFWLKDMSLVLESKI